MDACLLAIDTATDQLAVALSGPDGRDWRVNSPGGAQASATLLPLARQLLAEAGLSMAQLDAIAFGVGPGAFTGLRTACAAAQGLALGLDKPVLAIDSLLLVAEDARLRCAAPAGPWWVAVDARMDEVYAAQYAWGPDGWRVLRAPALYSLAALAQAWHAAPPGRVAGNATTAFAQQLPLGGAECWPDQADRAAALLRLARVAWQRGPHLAADDALPLYLRDKVAFTTEERALQRAALAG
jgi:tRNA threonylcarbamoyladenosine biosynthesis protein TsaB